MFLRSGLFLATRVGYRILQTRILQSVLSSRGDVVLVLWLWNIVQDSPDKATEFSGDSCNSDVAMLALIESPELFVESVLGFESNSNDGWVLSLSPSVQDEICAGAVSIIPGSFHQESSGVDVASFGDWSTSLPVA